MSFFVIKLGEEFPYRQRAAHPPRVACVGLFVPPPVEAHAGTPIVQIHVAKLGLDEVFIVAGIVILLLLREVLELAVGEETDQPVATPNACLHGCLPGR